MKRIIFIAGLLLVASTAYADQYVNGYTKKDGTTVDSYYRSTPNSSYNDNYSVKGNTNPYTSERGTAAPTYTDRSPEYNNRTLGNTGTIDNSNSFSSPYGTTKKDKHGY